MPKIYCFFMCYNRAGHKKFKKKSQLKFFLKDFLLECRSKLSRTKYLGYVLAVGRQKNEEVQLKALPAATLDRSKLALGYVLF